MMPSATTQVPKSTLPPPATYDILPPLHDLLSRLLLPPSQNIAQTSASPPAASPAVSSLSNSASLSPKDLATAASAIKVKIQKARVITAALPDTDRTVEEQEAEISELEAEVERLKGVLKNLESTAKIATQKLED